jgi:hypothetical protein
MIIEIWYGRFLVKPSPDAVTIEILDDAKAVTPSAGIDHFANVAKPLARSRGIHCIALCKTSCA